MSKKILLFVLALTLALSACSSPSAENSTAPTPDASPAATQEVSTPAPTPEGPEVILSHVSNPLTGLPLEHGDPNDRPIAVMLNNLKGALPQLGQSQADIIYEVLAEGGITRMLGLYQSTKDVTAIGSIRSARTYYLELALGHDAIYLHAGGSPDAYDKISKWKVTSLDGVSGSYTSLMWRDEGRRKSLGAVHSVITTGEAIAKNLPNYNIRLTHQDGYSYTMNFADTADLTSAHGGQPAQTVTVPYSGYKTGLFEYDPQAGTYLVSEYGKPYIDGNTKEQVSVTNVLVVKTACTLIQGDTSKRITVDLSSGGEGWYACGGHYVPIRWEKDFPDGQLRYYTQDGARLTLQAGKTYVNIVPLSANVTFQ